MRSARSPCPKMTVSGNEYSRSQHFVPEMKGFWAPMGFAESSVTKKAGFWLPMWCGDVRGCRNGVHQHIGDTPFMVDSTATIFMAALKSSSSLNQIRSVRWSVVTSQKIFLIDSSFHSHRFVPMALSQRRRVPKSFICKNNEII